MGERKLTDAQAALLRRARDTRGAGLPLQQRDFAVAGEVSALDYAKHHFNYGTSRHHLHITLAGRAAIASMETVGGGEHG